MTVRANVIEPATKGNRLAFENVYPGSILAVNCIRSNLRTAVNLSAEATLFGGGFVKLRSDTIIRATCTVFGAGYYSGNCGVGMYIRDGSVTYWDHGSAYQYDGAWSATQQTTIIFGSAQWTGISAGPKFAAFGWKPADNGTGNRPFNNFNPNASDDVRNQQMISTIILYEVYP